MGVVAVGSVDGQVGTRKRPIIVDGLDLALWVVAVECVVCIGRGGRLWTDRKRGNGRFER